MMSTKISCLFVVVFMGSEKYPGENCLDDYISKHGGETNAWTDNEKVKDILKSLYWSCTYINLSYTFNSTSSSEVCLNLTL